MKKVMAVALAVLLLLSLIPMAAFAAPSKEEVSAKIEAARDALYAGKETFTAAESYDFVLFLAAKGDGAPYKDAYIQSVKDAFEAGSMTTADRIALAMICLNYFDVDIENFELNDHSTINLKQAMINCGTEVDSPYNYRYVALCSDDADYVEQVLNEMESHYTAGSGYDYWGFSTDNTCNFGAIMAMFGSKQDLVDDAVNVVESAKTESGYYYLAEYGTDGNADSTASALYLYSILEDQEKADAAYELLKNFDLGDGNYAYQDKADGANAYATRDALKALLEYEGLFVEPEEDEPKEDTQDPSEDVVAPTDGVGEAKEQTQSTPATGDSLVACGVAGAAMLALGAALVMRKKKEQ